MTIQILTNDVQMLILCLSYSITTVNESYIRISHSEKSNEPLSSERLREFTVKMFRQKHLTSDCTVHSDVSARSESTTDNFQNITRK